MLSTEEAAREVVNQLTRNFPVYRTEIGRGLLRIVETRRASGLVGTVVLVLFSTPLFGAARLVVNRMRGVRAGPGLVRGLLRDAGMVVVLAVLLFAATVGGWMIHWLEEAVLAPTGMAPGWMNLALTFGVVTSATMFYLGYRYVPAGRMRPGPALAGAAVATALWEVAKQLFRLYIRRVGVYDQIYGPLGILVAFVMFVYYSAVVFVLGAAYAAALDARRGR